MSIGSYIIATSADRHVLVPRLGESDRKAKRAVTELAVSLALVKKADPAVPSVSQASERSFMIANGSGQGRAGRPGDESLCPKPTVLSAAGPMAMIPTMQTTMRFFRHSSMAGLSGMCYCMRPRHHAGIRHFGVVFYISQMLLNDKKLLDNEVGKPDFKACR
jgi:hypothetical protein